jgi:hypothetical protein
MLLQNQWACIFSYFWAHLSISIKEKPRKFHFTEFEIWSVLFTWHVKSKPSVSWHTSLHKISRKRIPSSVPTKVKKKRVVEKVWMNKWLLHQENNGQSRLGDSWHMRRPPSHLVALLSFHFSSCRLVSPHVFLFTMTRPANNSVTVRGRKN